ncbi:MAG TPA: AraC family transcriptional regulator [Franconibacter helveticus]|nr:AraC family transcriptional regulator [Franconibacter helveticus]
MDTLSQLIALLAPQGSVDLHCRFAGRWEADHPQTPAGVMPWHAILSGEARLETGGQATLVKAGDILLLPYGAPHLLSSLEQAGQPVAKTRRHNGTLTEVVTQGKGGELTLLCGEFHFGVNGALLFDGASGVVKVETAARDDCRSLRALLAMLGEESLSGKPGASAIVRELTATFLTLLLRALMHDSAPGMLALLADKRLAPAVAAVFSDPAAPWTLELLAERCFLSRATFARHFASRYAVKPQAWLTQVRMALAARLLAGGEMAVGRVAEACGYQTQAAFTRAFKNCHGVTPGQFRQRDEAA